MVAEFCARNISGEDLSSYEASCNATQDLKATRQKACLWPPKSERANRRLNGHTPKSVEYKARMLM